MVTRDYVLFELVTNTNLGSVFMEQSISYDNKINSVYQYTSWLPGVARVFIYPNVLSDRKRNELYL
jgi:hypothetical protein